jgi:hypothetical protein
MVNFAALYYTLMNNNTGEVVMLLRAGVFAMTAGLFVTVMACGNPSTSDGGASTVKWGFLRASSTHLVNKANGATIRLCGVELDTLAWAINAWGAEIGKRFQFVNDCNNAHINSYGATDPYAISECARWGYSRNMYVQSFSNPMPMVDCGIDSSYRQAAILHEAGHLWGMCDQYPEQISNCESTTAPVNSVMNASWSTSLSSDDITGIRALNRQRGN